MLKSTNNSDLEIFDAVDLKRAVEIYKCPEPHYEQGIWAAQNSAPAMMDISDGLLKDSSRLARSSGVSIELYGALRNLRIYAYHFPITTQVMKIMRY